jgi:hypothetical protein
MGENRRSSSSAYFKVLAIASVPSLIRRFSELSCLPRGNRNGYNLMQTDCLASQLLPRTIAKTATILALSLGELRYQHT